MKTKEEVIKEAWGISTYLGSVIDKNGWLSDKYLTNKQCVEFNDNIDLEYNIELGYRPKSLQGIENNNGWIRIESEADLPKKIIECVTCFYDGENYILGDTRERNPIQLWKSFKNNQITHYKPSIKHEKPLY